PPSGATTDHVPVAPRAWRFVPRPLLQGGSNGLFAIDMAAVTPDTGNSRAVSSWTPCSRGTGSCRRYGEWDRQALLSHICRVGPFDRRGPASRIRRRLLHRSHFITPHGDSYRLREKRRTGCRRRRFS